MSVFGPASVKAKIQTVIGTDVQRAADLLLAGRLVGMPTETVYGLAADATNALAVAAVFEAKQRPTFDPLIVHIANAEQLPLVVSEIPERARILSRAVWPGPLTIVLPKRPEISDLVTSGLPGVGVRVPQHPMALELLKRTARPLAAPSANLFGGISPTTAQHVLDGLSGRVDYILNGGACEVGVESTVISLMSDDAVVLRPGGFPIEQLERLIGPVKRAVTDPALDDAAQPAPGMLSRHYAPGTPMRLISVDELAEPESGRHCGLLTWGDWPASGGFERIFRICEDDNLQICAANFFAGLRDLDSAGLDVIIARRFPEVGLGVALNDRLRRGASGKAPAQTKPD
jgi:L-threonylcarbamoyladenylate synthase